MTFRLAATSMSISLVTACSSLPGGYRGRPFSDAADVPAPQVIPGRVECARYDLGGEGIAYHDADRINHGSGELNKKPGHQRPAANPAIWQFRESEGVDLSYTKDVADFRHRANLVDPPVNQLYIGWTKNGEWTNYTVDVKTAGTYRIVALYANAANSVAFAINYRLAAQARFPMPTGSMHKWNRAEVGTITFERAGTQLLSMFYNGGNNIAYLDFEPVSAAASSKPSEARREDLRRFRTVRRWAASCPRVQRVVLSSPPSDPRQTPVST
jgi:hypothetical protein